MLNGTTVGGLARSAADELKSKWYSEPDVVADDTTDRARQTTEIFYEPESREAATDVAKILGVRSARVKPMDANARGLGGRATVAAFVGADSTAPRSAR